MQTRPSQPIIAEARILQQRDSALERVCERIVDAGLAGLRWVVLPEGAIPDYPAWVWGLFPGEHPLIDALRVEAIANTVPIPSDVTDRLCQVVQRAQVNLAVGVIECDDAEQSAAIFSTVLFINARGWIIGRYRRPVVDMAVQWSWIPTEGELPTSLPLAISHIGGI